MFELFNSYAGSSGLTKLIIIYLMNSRQAAKKVKKVCRLDKKNSAAPEMFESDRKIKYDDQTNILVRLL